MGVTTKISWCDATFSPWLGCTKIAAGCANCYAAELIDNRYGKAKWGPRGTRVLTAPSGWKKLAAWNRKCEREGRRMTVFPSLCDPFEDWQGPMTNGEIGEFSMDDIRWRFGREIRACNNLTFILLTKRPENAARMMQEMDIAGASNVWLIASVAEQKDADANVPPLLECKAQGIAKVIGLSCEPLIGPVEIPNLAMLDWVITGCESGKDRRRFENDWARAILCQCKHCGVPAFNKQMIVGGKVSTDVSEFPEDMRVQQFPA